MKKEESENGLSDARCDRCGQKSRDGITPLKFEFFKGEFLCEECLAEETACGCFDPAD